ncbi:class I SAM-dependent methyltransferase [Rheinheimera marina]|uniref:Class I SAM-dependent methyltransferase n=1 Tax=Rheinheimera marina TaxID=1774958 RepID=A0ABV9JHA9_9GAMM
MTPEQIGQAYDQITHLWTRDSFNRHNGLAQLQRAMAFVRKPGPALDVGCGCTGRFLDAMLQHNYQPEGLDISVQMLKLARQRHPQLTFWAADLLSWQPDKCYQLISAWDSLWHIELSQQALVLKKLMAALAPGGVLMFSAGGVDAPGEHLDASMGPELYYASLGVSGYLQLAAEQGLHCRHFEFDQYPELHCWFVLQKPELTNQQG